MISRSEAHRPRANTGRFWVSWSRDLSRETGTQAILMPYPSDLLDGLVPNLS